MHRPQLHWLSVATLIAVCLLALAAAPRTLAQTPPGDPGTTPIPATMDWDQETQAALDAINAYRAGQQPPLPPLQVDAVLQRAAAWTANNKLVTRGCLNMADQGVISCDGLDTLARTFGERLTAFGYQGQAFEVIGFAGRDSLGDSTTGQGIVDAWRNSTRSNEPNQALLSPQATVIGIARQCQTFSYGFACLWWAYFGTMLNQPFTPPAPQ